MRESLRNFLVIVGMLGGWQLQLLAQEAATSAGAKPRAAAQPREEAQPQATDDTPADVLSREEWKRVDDGVERALTWLAGQQQPDGSFPTLEAGQPGVTSLCVMAFMAHGHVPGDATYGRRLERATDFVIASQKENGLLSRVGPDGPTITRDVVHEIGEAAAYNHAISALTLSELYGMSEAERATRIQKVVAKALTASLTMQRWPKDKLDEGGWRYVGNPVNGGDSDLSITGWELMFLRSARNAGFDVPKESIDDAVGYIRRCYSKKYGSFVYMRGNGDFRSRAMAGAGILALAHAGFHGAPEAAQSADWLLKYNFDRYNQLAPFRDQWPIDRYHYGLFNSCQGMYQLGGRYWEAFFPRAVRSVLDNQQSDGSWPAESHFNDAPFGNAYTTALVVLSLGAPNQFLPIFQR
jgi:hypothetical protein